MHNKHQETMPAYSIQSVPTSLKIWFQAHGIVDLILGIPLLFAPQLTLYFFGFDPSEPVLARVIGAALIGIGGVSLMAYTHARDAYSALLTMKLIWAGGATLAIIISLPDAPPAMYMFLVLFITFGTAWTYFKIKRGI